MTVKQRLNQGHRAAIALAMTRAAVNKKLRALVKKGNKLHAELYQVLKLDARNTLPELPWERIQELIRSQMLRQLGSLGHVYLSNVGNTSRPSRDDYGIARVVINRNYEDHEKEVTILRGLFDCDNTGPFSYQRGASCITLRFKALYPDLPAFRSTHLATHDLTQETDEVGRIMAAIQRTLSEWSQIVEAALSFHRDTSQVLATLNTVTQYLDTFPNCAGYLPADLYSKPQFPVVPAGLAENVHLRLTQGIPD